MGITNVQLCEFAEVGANGKVSVIGLFDFFVSSSMPFSRDFFCSVIFVERILPGSHEVKALVTDSLNQEITKVVKFSFDLPEKKENFAFIARFVNTVFSSRDGNKVEFFLDGEKIGSKEIGIRTSL